MCHAGDTQQHGGEFFKFVGSSASPKALSPNSTLLRKQTSSDPYMTDYVKHHPDKYRAVTIAGEIANIIKTIHQGVPLFIVPTQVAGGGTGPSIPSDECDLTISGNALFEIPANQTGTVGKAFEVCSDIAQIMTFAAYVSASGGGV